MNPEMHLVEDLSKIETIASRDGYGEGVVEAGKKNTNVVVLCCDLTESTRSDTFKKEFPDRFIELGVAEQNMAGVGAGMALSGKVPFVASYAVFSPGRNWDQIRVSICYTNANVKIIGAHAGISVGPDGATHQALEDIAITRVLPNMTVLVPADYEQTKKAVISAASVDGPVYIRFGRNKTAAFTTRMTPFEIGKAQVLRRGGQVGVIAAGPLVYEALMAAEELASEVDVEVINLHTIKPVDRDEIVRLAQKTKRIVTVEEHQINGGVGGAVAEVLMEEGVGAKMIRVGMRDSFGESGEPDELLAKYGMDRKAIIKAIRELA